MKVTCKGPTEIRLCPDCDHEHIGPPCGTANFAERLRSVKTDTSWMPAKQVDRADPEKSGKSYYDDETFKDMWGLDRKERKEMMLDETKGFGPLYKDSPNNPDHLDAILGPESDA